MKKYNSRFIEQNNSQVSSPVPEIEDREVVSPGQGRKVLWIVGRGDDVSSTSWVLPKHGQKLNT